MRDDQPTVAESDATESTGKLESGDRARLNDLEHTFREIGGLLQLDRNAALTPRVVVDEIEGRIHDLEDLQAKYSEARNQLSHRLALEQIDEMLKAGSQQHQRTRNIEILERRSRISRSALFCLLIAVDQSNYRANAPETYYFLLVQTAQRIMLTTRSSDLVLRYREDGFLLISNSQSLEQARGHAARVAMSVSAETVRMGPQKLDLSISISILQYEEGIGGANEMIRLAWESLEAAQQKGNRQLLVYRREPIPDH